jgi:hypothetical protein
LPDIKCEDLISVNNYLNTQRLHFSPNIVRVIKSRRMRWAGMWHAWGRGEMFTGFWLGSPKARDHWEDLGVDGRITLRWTIDRNRWGEMDSTGSG